MLERVTEWFPYKEFRPFQDLFVHRIYSALQEGRHIALEGCNGLGKTVASLSACLPIAEERELKVLFLTRTHRQTDRVIEELKEISRKREEIGKEGVSAISVHGKHLMCLEPRAKSSKPEETIEACIALKRTGQCPYFENYRYSKHLTYKLAGKTISALEVIRFSKKHEICPYELAIDLARHARVICLVYKYVFDPDLSRIVLKKIGIKPHNAILVIDEAHNLYDVALEILTNKITIRDIENAINEAEKYGYSELSIVGEALKDIISQIKEGLKQDEGEKLIEPKWFIKRFEDAIGSSIERCVKEIKEVEGDIRHSKLKKNEFPTSYLAKVGRFLSNWKNTMGVKDFVYLYSNNDGLDTLELCTFDARTLTEDIFKQFYSTVSMSGTLEPIEMYKEIVGLPKNTYMEAFPSPYPEKQVLILATRGITTSHECRTPEMYETIARQCIEAIKYTPGNVGLFAASYDVLEGLLKVGWFRGCIEYKLGREFFYERRLMTSDENEMILRKFKASKNAVLLAVQGGRSTEGVDYPGKEMLTCVIIGVPYAEPTVKLEKMREFYDRKYRRRGIEFAYTLPAMRKATQASGRAIRSLNDCGVMIFLDERFTTYCRKYIPRWISSRMEVIPNTSGEIAKRLVIFYEKNRKLIRAMS